MGAQYYNLKRVVCALRGVRVEGYAPNDAVGIQWHDDLVTVDTTADGQKVVSRTNDNGLDIIFSLMNTSESYSRLSDLMIEQYGLGLPEEAALIAPIPFRLADPAIGDFITSEYLIFRNRPAPIKGKQASVVQFRCMLPNPKVLYGLRNRRLIP